MEHLIAHIAGALTELPAISEDVDMLLEQAKVGAANLTLSLVLHCLCLLQSG